MSYFVVLYLAASCSFPIGMSGNGVDVVGESKCRATPVVRSFVRSILVSRGEHRYVLVVVLVVLIISEYWERRVRHVTHVPYINRKDSSQDVITSNRVGYDREATGAQFARGKGTVSHSVSNVDGLIIGGGVCYSVGIVLWVRLYEDNTSRERGSLAVCYL